MRPVVQGAPLATLATGVTLAVPVPAAGAVPPVGPECAPAAPLFSMVRVVVAVTETGASFAPPILTAATVWSVTAFCATTPDADAGPDPEPPPLAAPLVPPTTPASATVDLLLLSADAVPLPPPVET
jgi:hypothetical protein